MQIGDLFNFNGVVFVRRLELALESIHQGVNHAQLSAILGCVVSCEAIHNEYFERREATDGDFPDHEDQAIFTVVVLEFNLTLPFAPHIRSQM